MLSRVETTHATNLAQAESSSHPTPAWSSDLAILIYIAIGTVVAHLLTGGRYGFQRDELATLDDARHLAWGYVAYPPITPFFGRLSLTLFGTSLVGFRFFAVLVEAIAVVLTGLMARTLGGGCGAVLIAAAAAIPFCLGGGALMQYVSFDYFFWVLSAYFVVRLLQSNDPRWWVALGASIGLGMMSKYTMGFFTIGIVLGVLLTNARKHLTTQWLWIGVALSILIWLPNLIWQAQNHFISLEFLRTIHERDVRIGRTQGFVPEQFKLTLLALPLCIAGLYFYLFSKTGSRFRMLGWMYIVPLLLFVVAKGRWYYLAGAYPMLYAAGAVWGELWLKSIGNRSAVSVRALVWIALIADIILLAFVTIPTAPVNSALWKFASKNNGDLVEELGWPELVQEVAGIRDSLPKQDRSHLGILAANYGEAGAINLYGPSYDLPEAISGVNSFWARGYGNPAPETLIVLGHSMDFVQHHFASCELAGHTPNPYGIENEETSNHPDIYVCRGLRQGWPEFWNHYRHFG